jgi:hypothetical protein
MELGNDGIDIAEHVAIGEQVGEEMRHRRRAESGAEVLEGVAPTVADAALFIGLDARRDEFLVRVVAGAAHRENCGSLEISETFANFLEGRPCEVATKGPLGDIGGVPEVDR